MILTHDMMQSQYPANNFSLLQLACSGIFDALNNCAIKCSITVATWVLGWCAVCACAVCLHRIDIRPDDMTNESDFLNTIFMLRSWSRSWVSDYVWICIIHTRKHNNKYRRRCTTYAPHLYSIQSEHLNEPRPFKCLRFVPNEFFLFSTSLNFSLHLNISWCFCMRLNWNLNMVEMHCIIYKESDGKKENRIVRGFSVWQRIKLKWNSLCSGSSRQSL